MATWSRREIFCVAGAVTAASVAKASGAAAGQLPPELLPGLRLGPCTLVRLLPIERDALPFELRDPEGNLFVVEAHRHDPKVPGIARAGSLDVFLVNGGNGTTPTDEARGLGAMALAAILRHRERAGAAPPAQVVLIVDRWKRHPGHPG